MYKSGPKGEASGSLNRRVSCPAAVFHLDYFTTQLSTSHFRHRHDFLPTDSHFAGR